MNRSVIGRKAAAYIFFRINLGKIIKDGILSDIESIHRITIDRAVERKKRKNE